MAPTAERRTATPRGRAANSKRVRSEQTELNLLSTSTWLFSERGFHGTGIRDIADAAGVAVSAMYYYAASKDELLEEIMKRSLTVLDDAGRAAVADVDGAAERLAMLIGSHVAFHTRNPRAARVTDHEFRALQGPAKQRVVKLRDAYEDLWNQVISAGVAEGVFVDRGATARLALLQMTTGIAHWYNPRGALGPAELWADFATMALALLGANRKGKPVELASLELGSPAVLLERVELSIEPRSKPKGL
ncbi:MAG: TetR family transcriptional regulator [Nocardioidaceae bacterium]|nr:TetR family transcriptional regulator [Nocardioidaceae bacterium]